jgi:large subunit ribosomal protein L24
MNKKTHFIQGDQVKVITGSKKGFMGKISSIFTKKSLVIIEGILPRLKYKKSSSRLSEDQAQAPTVQELPLYIHISNVMLWDPEVNQVSRIGYKKFTNQNKKQRFFKKSGTVVSK